MAPSYDGEFINRHCGLALLTNNDDLITYLHQATQGCDIYQTLIHTDLPNLWTAPATNHQSEVIG